MTLYVIAVYHNTESRFFPYQDGQALTQVISHWRDLPADTSAEHLAAWAYRVFNADLDMLEPDRHTPDGEANFLLASVYRLLRLRSLSIGDVIAVSPQDKATSWLACDMTGWRQIHTPTNMSGKPLTAEAVYTDLAARRTRS